MVGDDFFAKVSEKWDLARYPDFRAVSHSCQAEYIAR